MFERALLCLGFTQLQYVMLQIHSRKFVPHSHDPFNENKGNVDLKQKLRVMTVVGIFDYIVSFVRKTD